MQTYLSDLVPKIQRYSQKLDDLALLTNQHWVVMDEIDKCKNVYIFRANNELLVSSDGEVEKGRWEYLGNNSLLIDRKNKSYLFKHGFFDENILALKIDGKNEYAFLVNENKYDGELDTLAKINGFLAKRYIEPSVQKTIDVKYGLEKPSVPVKTPDQLKQEQELDKLYGWDSKIGVYVLFTIIAIIAILTFVVVL